MNSYDVKRFALVLAVQAKIEGMKAANEVHKCDHGAGVDYDEKYFQEKAEELKALAYAHEEQLFG